MRGYLGLVQKTLACRGVRVCGDVTREEKS